jgi:two-component system nitrate/nitrite response regulator NarL
MSKGNSTRRRYSPARNRLAPQQVAIQRRGMRVLVADDHPLYREAVTQQIMRLLPDATVEEASSLDEALTMARAAPPGLFVFDYYMPGMSANAIAGVVTDFPDVPILVLSGGAGAAEVQAIIQAGAQGFLPKTATREQFIHTIHLLLAGGTSVPAEMLMPGGMQEETPPWMAALTPRETDVLRATARGLSNKEIARELDLAEVTIKLHLSAIFRKMGVRSRTKAAMLATRTGIA